MALWFYGTPQGQYGPVEEAEVRALIASGAITPMTMLWTEGMNNWQALQFIPRLNGGAVVIPPPGGGMPFPGGGVYRPAESNGLAIASMICGIFAIFTCGLTGIPAIVCGHVALAQINRDSFGSQGRGMAVAGLGMGYLMTLIGIAFFVLIIVSGGASHHYPSAPPGAPAPSSPASPISPPP